jgi:hypothetical protein
MPIFSGEQVSAISIYFCSGAPWRLVARGVLVAFCFAALTGCSLKPLTDPIVGPDHVLHNVYHNEAVLPGSLKRVAVLPLSYNDQRSTGPSAVEMLQPIFQAELTKVARFECYFVQPSQLALWTGKERWDDFDELPASFLKEVAERAGCDGVMFGRISNFRAYPPIVIGWRLRLVSNEAGQIWAADEIFDAADQGVSNSARRYNRGRPRNNPVLEDSRSILLSPSEFGQYTLANVLGTLPMR